MPAVFQQQQETGKGDEEGVRRGNKEMTETVLLWGFLVIGSSFGLRKS